MSSIYRQYLILQRHPNISQELQDCLGGYSEEAVGLHLLPKQLHSYFMGPLSNAADPGNHVAAAGVE